MPAKRWARRAVPFVVAVVIAIAIVQRPAPAVSGSGLAVSLSLGVLLAATVIMVRRGEDRISSRSSVGSLVCADADRRRCR